MGFVPIDPMNVRTKYNWVLKKFGQISGYAHRPTYAPFLPRYNHVYSMLCYAERGYATVGLYIVCLSVRPIHND